MNCNTLSWHQGPKRGHKKVANSLIVCLPLTRSCSKLSWAAVPDVFETHFEQIGLHSFEAKSEKEVLQRVRAFNEKQCFELEIWFNSYPTLEKCSH